MAEAPAGAASTQPPLFLTPTAKKLLLDIHGCVQELKDEYTGSLFPIDDDNQNLHRFCHKLEYLLRWEQKDKFSLLGNRKDYWDYFCKCLASARHVHDSVKFVKSVTEFKTSLGRGRAFLRFCLMHGCLADTLQQCFQNRQITSDFYREGSPLLSHGATSRLIGALYDLSDVTFDLCPHGYDLDVAWPSFARRSFVTHQYSSSQWRVPSRTVSMSSLVSTTQQPNRDGWQESFASKGYDCDEDELEEEIDDHDQVHGELDPARKQSMPMGEESRLKELEEAWRKAAERAAQLESQLEEKSASCTALEERLEAKRQAEEVVNDQLTAARYEKQSVTEELDKWKQLVSKYVDRLAIKERVNEHLEKQVNALREATDALREMMELRTSECTALKNLVQDLKTHRSLGGASKDEHRQVQRLEADTEALTDEVGKLRDRICELESEKSEHLARLKEHVDCETSDEASKALVNDLNRELEALRLENRDLVARLDVLRGWMLRVQTAEAELAEAAGEKMECSNDLDGDGGEQRADPEGMGEDCGAEPAPPGPVVFKEDLSLIEAMRRTLSRLQVLIADHREGSASDETATSSSEATDDCLVSRVMEQEAKLSCVTMELSEARVLLDQLRNAFTCLQSSEAVLRYELGEKRTVVERLRQQLETSRSQWSRIRQKHSESEQDLLSLRAEFASRLVPPPPSQLTSQGSEESGCEELVGGADANAFSIEGDDLVGLPSAPTSPSPDVDNVSCGAVAHTEEVMTPVSESPSTSSNYGVGDTTRNSRLRLMEEQCRLLYAQLVQSRKKSELLEWKLARLHVRHGGTSSELTTESDELVAESSVGADEEEEEEDDDDDDDDDDDVHQENVGLEREEIPSDADIPEVSSPREDDEDARPSVRNDDAAAESTSKSGGALALARALPRRIVKLKREKENLARDVSRLRRAQRQSEDGDGESLRADLERSRATLVEFKRRVELVMRKEREEREARYRVAVDAKRDLQIKVERLETEVRDRQSRLERLEEELRCSTDEWNDRRLASEQELNSLRFRLSSEALSREQAAKHHARHESDIALLTDKLAEHEELVMALEEELAAIRKERQSEIECRNAKLEDLQLCLATREDECTVLNNELKETTRVLDDERQESAGLKTVAEEARAECIRLRGRLDEALLDLHELQKKIIKLIREKDRLWQRSEHLSFQQKMQATDRWLKDDEVTHCLACRAEFTLVLRKHHCRLCGRIFCFNCCNHWAMTTSSSRQVRVCNECIISHSQIDNTTLSLENDDDSENEESGIAASASGPIHSDVQSPSRDDSDGSQSSNSSDPSRDDTKDLGLMMGSLAEEAREEPLDQHALKAEESEKASCSGAASSTLASTARHEEQSSACSGSVLGRLFSSWNSSSMKSTTMIVEPNDDEFCVISDEEIMKSLSGSSPYWPLTAESSDPSVYVFPMRTVDEIVEEFERGLPREVWVDAGKSCAVPILIKNRTTLTWAFTTEPKSIVFTLLFHSDTRLDDASGESSEAGSRTSLSSCATRVLVPRTHCDSHLHPVHGKLVAKRVPGVYTLYFDNGFSRFTAKKVKFIIRVNRDDRSTEHEATPRVSTSLQVHDEDKDPV